MLLTQSMKYPAIALALILLARCGAAQSLPVKTTLFQAPGDNSPTPAEAVYRVERTETPGQTRLDSVYYVASKRLLSVSTSSQQPNGDTLTTTTSWRANGKLHYVKHELGKKAHGEYVMYDEQGRLWQKVQFERGEKVGAECFSKTGAAAACPEYMYTEKMPVFPGGSMQAFLARIGRSVRDPGVALKNNQQGIVLLSFVVDETGQIRNIQVVESLSSELDAEAVRVLKSVSGFRPGQQNGEAVPVHFAVPVTFAIR